MPEPEASPNLACGLPRDMIMTLRSATALGRLNYPEIEHVFECLHNNGFRIIAREER